MSPNDVAASIDGFNRHKGIMLCSIKYAQAFSLASASVCFFLGFEWDPPDNYQAEARLDTIMHNNAVMAYYLTHYGTVEDRVFEVLDKKQTNMNTIFRPNNMREIKELIARN